MRYYVSVDGRMLEVELGGEHPLVDGEPLEADLAAGAEGEPYSLLVAGRSHTLMAERGEERGAWRIELDGIPYEVEAVDERARAIRALTGGAGGQRGLRPIRAPMPGLVVRLEVEEGQVVQPGDGVVIVEAMKMENELKAESAGRVARIRVRPGEAVEKGTVLVEFEAAAAARETT